MPLWKSTAQLNSTAKSAVASNKVALPGGSIGACAQEKERAQLVAHDGSRSAIALADDAKDSTDAIPEVSQHGSLQHKECSVKRRGSSDGPKDDQRPAKRRLEHDTTDLALITPPATWGRKTKEGEREGEEGEEDEDEDES
jgi:hypothetical protein